MPAGSVSIEEPRDTLRSGAHGGAEDNVRVVNVASATRVRLRQSVQMKPAVRVCLSPAAAARVVKSRPARVQVND